jgi:ZIP family zinc transporter
MGQIILYAGIAGLALVTGAILGIFVLKIQRKYIAVFMAFGSGTLICAVTFGLMNEAFKYGGFDMIILGFLLGGILFVLGDYFLHKAGGRAHKRHIQKRKEEIATNGKAIAMGEMLDGIPESIALGIALFTSPGGGLLMLVAIALENIPESQMSVAGLSASGFSKKKIISMWVLIALVSLVISILSFIFLKGANPNFLGFLEAFAGGAILAMLAVSVMPEAYEDGGPAVGMVTVVGFLLAFILSRI